MTPRRLITSVCYVLLIALGGAFGYSLTVVSSPAEKSGALFGVAGAAIVGVTISVLHLCRERLALALPPGPSISTFLIMGAGLVLAVCGWLVGVFAHVRTGALLAACGWLVGVGGLGRYLLWSIGGRDV